MLQEKVSFCYLLLPHWLGRNPTREPTGAAQGVPTVMYWQLTVDSRTHGKRKVESISLTGTLRRHRRKEELTATDGDDYDERNVPHRPRRQNTKVILVDLLRSNQRAHEGKTRHVDSRILRSLRACQSAPISSLPLSQALKHLRKPDTPSFFHSAINNNDHHHSRATQKVTLCSGSLWIFSSKTVNPENGASFFLRS